MTTATVTDSFYLDRLKRSHDKYQKPSNPHYGYRVGRLRFKSPVEITDLGVNYFEEEYKGYQLIIVEDRDQWSMLYDPNGSVIENYASQLTSSYVTHYCVRGDRNDQSTFYAYAWKIGGISDSTTDLNWSTQFAVLAGVCVSDSLAKTRKQAMKKLDTLASLDQIKNTLISLCNEQLWHHNSTSMNPYNAKIGDHVFVQAHGRLRQGVIIETTGARFVVGYVTPSNHVDLKIKVVRLNQLWIKSQP
jgi:hypothetical protein